MTHFGHDDGSYSTQCGAVSYDKSDDRTAVTCRRCLASLAKRDREFRARARRQLGLQYGSRCFASLGHVGQAISYRSANDAARAIAREEGRL